VLSFIEGEGWLNEPVISDVDKKSVVRHSPNVPETVFEQSQATGVEDGSKGPFMALAIPRQHAVL
jgi:hypothetical protein